MDALVALDLVIENAGPDERPGLVVALAARLAVLGAGLSTPPARPCPDGLDRNIGVEEAARLLGISRRYLYRNAGSLPFVVREGRRLLVSSRRLAAYQQRRQS